MGRLLWTAIRRGGDERDGCAANSSGLSGSGPGDEVIIPSFTIISCATAVIYNGCVPVLVDAHPRTWCMDVSQIEAKIGPRTRAIMPVHIYGHPVEMEPVLKLAKRYGLSVIEDAAEAHGAEYRFGMDGPNWRRCGSFGALSAFSFYGNKIVTTGEGGMVLTDDAQLAARARSLRNLCFETSRRFYHESLGHNFRMTNLQAALGLGQLERIAEIVARKKEIGRKYTERLEGLEAIQLPVEESWARNVYWVYGVVLKEKKHSDAEHLARELKTRGIETRPFFLGMHEQPALHRLGYFRDERFPVTELLARRGLYLPSGTALTDHQLEKVCESVRACL